MFKRKSQTSFKEKRKLYLQKTNNSIKTPFGAYKNRNINQKLALSGVFFSLVILFQFLERYMPFASTYINLNFSLLFILPIFYFAGPSFGVLILILRFLIGPAMSSLSYSALGFVSHFILLNSSIVVLLFLYLNSYLFRNIKILFAKYVLISLLTIFISSILLTLLNGLFFSPLFWKVLKIIPNVSLITASEYYESNLGVQGFHFGISNYWGAMFAVYFSANIVKFGLIFIINYPLSKVIRTYIFMGR